MQFGSITHKIVDTTLDICEIMQKIMVFAVPWMIYAIFIMICFIMSKIP